LELGDAAMPICMAAIPSTYGCPGKAARIAPKFDRMISPQTKKLRRES
jgi:hypothetical protein